MSDNSLDKLSLIFLSISLLFIPLPIAGMTAWASFVFVSLISFSLTFVIIANTRRDKAIRYNSVYLPWLVVFFTVSGWIVIQLLLIPKMIGWKLFFAEPIPDINIEPRAVNIQQSLHYWALFSAYWSCAFMVSRMKIDKLKIILWVVIASFAFQLIYGILADLKGYKTIIGIWPKIYYTPFATGTFVNHNHYAGFIEVCWPLVLSYLYLSKKRGGLALHPFIRIVLMIVVTFLSLIALILSGSRMGLVAALIGVSVWFWVFCNKELQLSRGLRIIMIFFVWFILFSTAIWFGLGEIVERFLRLLSVEGRWEIWSNVFEFPIHSWLWGIGAGAFSDAYMLVHSHTAFKTAYEAHNDYLQFIIEFGVIGTILVLISILFWLKKRLPSNYSIIRLGGFCGIISLAIHSIVDFNLQIPGTAAYFWVAVGCVMNKRIVLMRSRKSQHLY